MQVRTLFFAAYRDLLGTGEMDVDLPAGSTVSRLVHQLRARGGSFQSLPAEPAVAVNQEYAPMGAPLSDGDEVAFIPPVAGG